MEEVLNINNKLREERLFKVKKLLNEIKRMQILANYPLLVEVMEISSDFNNNEFKKQKNAVTLEVGINSENNEQYRLNLILSFGSPLGYLELAFYFNLTDIENLKITSKPKSIYDREIAKKYLPKDLIGKNIFMPKLKEMLKRLLKMETPEKFIMETFEDHTDRKQIDYYDNLVKIILENGYVIKSQGINSVTKKYAWKFIRENTLTPLSEATIKHWENFNDTHSIRDEEYWKKHDAEVEIIMQEHMRQMRERDVKSK